MAMIAFALVCAFYACLEALTVILLALRPLAVASFLACIHSLLPVLISQLSVARSVLATFALAIRIARLAILEAITISLYTLVVLAEAFHFLSHLWDSGLRL